ncbi:MAG: amphi-Trp domain-containing protein [Desulfovibrionales bacterium]|nr:amphi-Trp domain-containing protein [Desulfovibrionales bacterium]
MSEKKTLLEIEETRLTYMAGMLLKEIAAGLSRRQLTMQGPQGPVTMALPKEVDVEYSIEEKTKDGETKTELEIEISWKS